MRELLGLFPSFLAGRFGGVEASAAAAWRGLRCSFPNPDATLLISFGAAPAQWDHAAIGPAVFPETKGAALREAWKAGTARTIFLWHIGLLKLLPALRTRNARVVLYQHGIEVWREPDWLTRRLLSRVNLFLSNSDFTWERSQSYFRPHAGQQHQTVALGLGNAQANPAPLDETQPPAAVIVGRMEFGEGYKGHRELIQAWPQVQQQIPRAELWIIGGGNQRPELEALSAKCNVQAAVRFHGQVSDERKEELLRQSRCLVMPSRGEGFGLVYLEAMRLGRPCLVSTSDAGREVVQPPVAGLAADPSNTAELSAAIVRLLTPGAEWSRWSTQAQNKFNANFTEQQFVERLGAALFAPAVASPAAVGTETLV